MKARILGCGSSGGVPRVGSGWGACDPANPRNRRTRSSILVSCGRTRILVDTSPDMREQLLAADCHRLDAVFYTHVHADQAHGIDDLRGMVLVTRQRIPVYGEAEVLNQLKDRFDYCFRQVKDYPPILTAHPIDSRIMIDDVPVTPVQVVHGSIAATGYRIGDIGYIPDVSDMSEDAFSAFDGLELLILDALRYRPHPSHIHLDRALAWIARLKPKKAVLTNLHVDMDYNTLCSVLPAGVAPAYDGLEIEVGPV